MSAFAKRCKNLHNSWKFAGEVEVQADILLKESFMIVWLLENVCILLVTRFDTFISVETKCQNIQTTRAWFCMLEELKEQHGHKNVSLCVFTHSAAAIP